PWDVQIGETEKFLHVRDSVVVRVENLDPTGRIGVTMLGEGLGKLEGGTIVTVSPARIPRVVGRGGSMVETITRHTGARVAVGQNGRVWIDGTPDAILRASEALRLIEDQGQRRGLTERVESYLVASSHSDERGPVVAPRESAHRDMADQAVPPVEPTEDPFDPEGTGPAPYDN
ncbi:MAG: KH domain-containing protein, partial [Candidatus Lutacidiplasmatales archaeon]